MSLTSRTDVANLALSEIGARRITNIETDESVEAKSCRLHLGLIVDGLLRRHQWSFAEVRAALSRIDDTPATEWKQTWALPADCIRLIRITNTNDPHNPVREFALEGRRLLTRDLFACSILYVSNAIPVPHWDPLFTQAVAFRLAAAIAGDVTQNPAAALGAMQKVETLAMPAAVTADARESASGENFGAVALISQSGLVRARYAQTGRPPFIPRPS